MGKIIWRWLTYSSLIGAVLFSGCSAKENIRDRTQPSPPPVLAPPAPEPPKGPSEEELRQRDAAVTAACVTSWQAWQTTQLKSSVFAAINNSREVHYTPEMLQQALTSPKVNLNGLTLQSLSIKENTPAEEPNVTDIGSLDFTKESQGLYTDPNFAIKQKLVTTMRKAIPKLEAATLVLFYISDSAALAYMTDPESQIPMRVLSESIAGDYIFGNEGFYTFQKILNSPMESRTIDQESLIWFAKPLGMLNKIAGRFPKGQHVATAAKLLDGEEPADPSSPIIISYPARPFFKYGKAGMPLTFQSKFNASSSDLVATLPTSDCLKRMGYKKISVGVVDVPFKKNIKTADVLSVYDFRFKAQKFIDAGLAQASDAGVEYLRQGAAQVNPAGLALIHKIKEYEDSGLSITWNGLGADTE